MISILTISLISFLWPEILNVTQTGEESYWKFLKGSVTTVKQNHNLIRVVLYSVIVFSVFSELEEFNDVYLRFLGYPNAYIGVVFSLAMVAQSAASVVAHKFKHKSWLTLDITAIIGIVILVLAALIKHPFMAIAVLFLSVLLEFSRVLNEGVIQREVPAHQRATIASLNGFVANLIPLQLAFGYIANTYRLQLSYAFLAIYCLTYFLFLPFLKTKRQLPGLNYNTKV